MDLESGKRLELPDEHNNKVFTNFDWLPRGEHSPRPKSPKAPSFRPHFPVPRRTDPDMVSSASVRSSRFLPVVNPCYFLFTFLAFHVPEGLTAPPGVRPHWYIPLEAQDEVDTEDGAHATKCSSPNLLFFFSLCPCFADTVPFDYDLPVEESASAPLLSNQPFAGRANDQTLPMNGRLHFPSN